MSVRGIGDAYAFQRLLWLLIGMVVLPTVLLAIYGVFAIRNQRAAVVQRIQADRGARIRWAAGELLGEIDRIDARVHREVARCIDTPPCGPLPDGAAGLWQWQAGSAPPAHLIGIGAPAPEAPDTVWFTPSDATAPVGVFVLLDQAVAWRLDIDHLVGFLGGLDRGFDEDGGFTLVRIRAGRPTTFEDLMERWQEPAYAVQLPLDRPLANWALGLDFRGSDPAAGILARNAFLWLLGLVALVGTVIAGTFITLSSAMREIRLSRLQTDFVSHLSHELRTPLTSIQMFIETLRSGRLQDPDRVRECLDLLAQESDRLSRRIERVLEWGRMEAGRRIYEIEQVAVRDVVQDALDAFRSQTLLDDAGLEIQVDLDDDLPLLDVDRDAIAEALLNLLQNALKYCHSPRRVVITAKREGRWLGLSVEDNGPGIPRRERKRIFEKFYQPDALLSRSTDGSGLGLAIVRAVVQGHGGRVHLWSELGRGSRFTLWLPGGGGGAR